MRGENPQGKSMGRKPDCLPNLFSSLLVSFLHLSLTFRRRASPLTELYSGYLLTIRLKFPSYLDFLFAMGYACQQKIIYSCL
jgi:hypothetical protein